MQSELVDLRISDREIERLSQLEVSDLLIGGLLGGVYRLPVNKTRQRSRDFIFTEIVVTGLVFVFSIPVGLAVIRDASNYNHPIVILSFLVSTIGVTSLVLLLWHLYLWKAAKPLRPLMHLLDERDRFHRVLDSVSVMDQLRSVQTTSHQMLDRERLMTILQSTRDNIVAGLRAEYILRQSQYEFRSQSGELMSHIGENLALLSSMESNQRIQEFSTVLHESLEIGLRVQEEIRQISTANEWRP